MERLQIANRAQGGKKGDMFTDLNSDLSAFIDDSSLRVSSVN